MAKFAAVTPDNTVETITQVKVREAVEISPEELAIVQKFQPEFKTPEPKMHRLELIDKEIADLQTQIDSLMLQLSEKQVLREQVELAAAAVKLRKPGEVEVLDKVEDSTAKAIL